MIVKKYVTYAGIEKPETVSELKVEILGLRNVIKIAEELISRYEQVFSIMELTREGLLNATQTDGSNENKKSSGAKGTEGSGFEGEKNQGA